ncbi:MAG TPA: cytochrome P450 [Nitrospira sp.]|nr:cytochrome P450 [Nitrospira sp.]
MNEARHVATEASPPGLPLVGHLPWFLPNRLKFLETCARRYGDVVKLNLGGNTYLLTDPEDIKHVLVTNPDNYEKTPRMMSRKGKLVSGDGLLTASAAGHLRERRMLQPVFYRTSLMKFSSTIARTAEEIFNAWKPGTQIDMGSEMARLAQRVIVRTVFGMNFDDRNGQLADAITARKRYLNHIFFSLVPMAHYIPPWTWWRYRQAMQRIRAAIVDNLRLRRGHDAPGDDLLSLLMRARYDDGSSMSDRHIHDEAMILLITGYESIGDALSWSLYLLSRHRDVARALATEIDAVLGRRMPSAEDLHRLSYTGKVLAETLRLYPPSWMIVRIARQTETLPSGTCIPGQSKLYLCPYVMHRHPRYYPNPERFDPERFDEAARKGRPQFSYFPFGGGARVCIGEHFARLEATLVLAMAVQRFTFRLVPGQDIVPEPRMTLRPRNGLRMLVETRG